MKILFAIEKGLLVLGLFLLPLAFLPIFLSPFEPVKMALLYLLLALLLLTSSAKAALTDSLTFFASKFDLAMAGLALVYLTAAILKTPNKMEAFFIPGTSAIIFGPVSLFWLVKSHQADKKNFLTALLASGVTVSVISLLALTGVLTKIPQLPALAKNTLFSPLGSKLNEAIFLAILLPLGAGLAWTEKEIVKKSFWLVALGLISLNLALSVYNLLPGKPAFPSLPNLATSWAVAVDTLKTSPVLGIGPGNYLTAFNSFRPLTYNSTPVWMARFTTANNFVLTLVTETGLLGITIFSFLLFRVIQAVKTPVDPYLTVSLGLALIFLFIFPVSLTQLVVIALLLGLTAKVQKTNFPIPSKTPLLVLAFLVIAAVGALGFWGSRALAAESKFKKSIDALTKNDGKAAYDLMGEVTLINPRVDRYHAAYSQVNLALARALAQAGQNLTETDRQTITQLISQTIREAKAAVALNPQRAGNWEILAKTYQAIMPFAQGADNFAIQTFNQAVALDPINTDLRIALGGVFYALGRYDEAIDTFKLAVLTKPDHANAHYNLAAAFREKGEIEKAITEMKTVLSLVKPDSPDYQLAKTELDSLEKKRPAKEVKGTENLTPPQPAETPVIEPQLELPKEATPPT